MCEEWSLLRCITVVLDDAESSALQAEASVIFDVSCAAMQIAYLENGQVAEAGSHADLLRKGGRYAELWNQQASNVKETIEEIG